MMKPIYIGLVSLALAACGSRLETSQQEQAAVKASGAETAANARVAGGRIKATTEDIASGATRGVRGTGDAVALGFREAEEHLPHHGKGPEEHAARDRERMNRNYELTHEQMHQARIEGQGMGQASAATVRSGARTAGDEGTHAVGDVRRAFGEHPNAVGGGPASSSTAPSNATHHRMNHHQVRNTGGVNTP